MRISLREITSEMVSAICELRPAESQMKFVASNAASIAEARANPDYAWYRAIYADNDPVGFVMLGINPHEDFCFLWRFMIDAKYQKKGYGKRALELAISEVESRPNIKRIVTSYREGEGGPGDFYRGVGFKEVDNIEEYGALGEKIKKVEEVALELKIERGSGYAR